MEGLIKPVEDEESSMSTRMGWEYCTGAEDYTPQWALGLGCEKQERWHGVEEPTCDGAVAGGGGGGIVAGIAAGGSTATRKSAREREDPDGGNSEEEGKTFFLEMPN